MRIRTLRALLTFCFGLTGCVSAWAAYKVTAWQETQRASAQFDEYVTERASALEAEVVSVAEVLYSLKALFDLSREVTREEFATFVRDALARHPSIQALEWIPRVSGDEREAHEGRARATGLAEYGIRDQLGPGQTGPAAPRAEYFPVCFVEPYAGNEDALGFDLGSNAVRRAALDRAMATGQLTLTDPVVLVQERRSSRGILAFLPVHRRHGSAIQATPAKVKGFVVAVFRIADVIRAARLALDGHASPMHFELIDVDARGDRQVLHASAGSTHAFASMARRWVRRIPVGGRDWRLVGCPTPAFLSRKMTMYPVARAAGGFVLMWMLGGLVFFLAKRSRDLALRRQDRSIRSVLRSLVEGVVVANKEGRILFANEAAERMVGMSADAARPGEWSTVFGCHLPDMVTPYPEQQLPLARAIRGETVADQDIFLRHSGATSGIWLRASGAPLFNEGGDLAGGVVTLRNVTARKKSEELVRRLSSAVEQTADSVFITDRDGRILYVNPAFEATTGYASEEALGKTPRILRSGEQDLAYYEKLWATVLGGDVFRSTTVNRKKNGELYYAEQTITPMKDQGGRVTHFVSVAKDMTEHRRIQEQTIEMRLAGVVQQQFYPQEPPDVPGLDIAGAVFSAEATCGDYFDFIPMRNDSLGVAIGDVSGHGLGPALVMAQTRAYLRAFAQTEDNVAEILGRVNKVLFPDLRSGFFVTLLLAAIDLSTRRVVYASAGHTPGHILDPSGEVKHVLARTGMPLGVEAESAYELAGDIVLEPGDLVMFLTDGVTESRSPQGEFFEAEGALAVVKAHRHERARQIVEHVHSGIRDFRASQRQLDDITMVVCKLNADATT
jgi:PAS domain S-box-containing protein